MDIYTPENMIRFLYNETSAEETAILQQALDTDWSFREKFEVLKRAMEDLDTLHHSPRPSAIHSLLKYAGVSKELEKS